jgi:hypothetical protein
MITIYQSVEWENAIFTLQFIIIEITINVEQSNYNPKSIPRAYWPDRTHGNI